MSVNGKEITVEGHRFQIVTEQSGGTWRAEVVNDVKSAFAFDPTFDSEAEAVAHVAREMRSTDIKNYLG